MSSTKARIALQQSRFNLIQNAADLEDGDVPSMNRQLINTRLEMLEQNWTKFQEEHENLCFSQSEIVSEHEYVRGRVFERCQAFYIYSRAKLLTHRDELENTDRSSGIAFSERGPFTSFMPRSALPRIHLPMFTGDLQSWRSFHDLFSAMIRDNPSLSFVEKMHYLRTSLSGEAARLISNLSLSGDNFQVAWNLLTLRYENKRLLITSQVERLMSLKPLKTKSAKELGFLLTTACETIGALCALGCSVHTWNPLLLHLLVRLLDSDTREAWEVKLGSSSTFPTFSQFEEFLLTRTQTLEHLISSAVSSATSKDFTNFGKHHTKVVAHTAHKPETLGPSPCILCGLNHYLMKCTSYQSKTPQQRRDLVMSKRLCYNCLGSHAVSNCFSLKRCLKCGKKHHSSIHGAIVEQAKTNVALIATNNGKEPSANPSSDQTSLS